jgi:hypothetical protein
MCIIVSISCHLRYGLLTSYERNEALFALSTRGSAIDNATRALLAIDPLSLPITVGLFFSLGHSTIVIIVNIAISISTSVFDRIDGGRLGEVGGIIGMFSSIPTSILVDSHLMCFLRDSL